MSGPAPRPALAGVGGPMAGVPELLRPGVVRLCSNEGAVGPSPLAVAAATAVLARGHEYPEDEGGDLIAAIGARYGVDPKQIRIGPGSDTLVLNVIMAFAGPGDEIIFPAHGYARYVRNAAIVGATPVPVAGREMFRGDIEAMLRAVTPRTRVVMIANPDNPSGAMLSLAEIEYLHARLPDHVLLLLDCAYAEFVRDPAYGDGGLALMARSGNVVVSHTFSKLFALAGLRLGWIAGHPALLAAVTKVGPTFPVSLPALAAGRAALEDVAHQRVSRAHNDEWLPRIAERLAAQRRLHVHPSQSNFVLVDFPDAAMARDCTAALAAENVLVRRFGPGVHAAQMRISIGDAAGLERAADLIDDFLEGLGR